MGNLFVQCWKGQASLAKAFWIVYFLFGILLAIIVSIILALVIPNFSYVAHSNLVVAILFPYTVYSAICVWRCGKNSVWIWSVLSKIIVSLAVISGLLHLYHLAKGR